ncbi:hypothetical protein KIW84_065871 [Lathyrus oleraceus]|uniref:Uncharacterized protein n=1 Tax=Pisum sativum TaxID=3888 RepID=A0A9D4WFH4_PEA|nr:hypothetical protein KIW84_065871 [Pisum sativum]
MSQPFVSTPSKSSKEKSNPKNIGTEIDLSDVIINVVPFSIVSFLATPMRKAILSSSRKIKPNKVSTSYTPSITTINMNDPESPTDCPAATNVMENVEASETNNKPRSVTTLSKSSMIIADRDNVYKNIRVLISQLLGIDPKINVVPDVSSLAHPDNNTKSPRDNPDEHAPTLSPEKSQDKERPEDITNELVNNDKNHVDQPIDIVNIEELNFDDIPIGQRLTPDIAKRLKNRKGQDVGSSNTSSKSVRKKASVGPTKRWSKALSEEKGGVKDDGTDEEEENEDMTGASDEEDTNNDKD